MSNTALFLTIIVMGLVTFSQRFAFIFLSDRLEIPDLLRRGLTYVPPAVLSAIVFPDIFVQGGQIDLSLTNPYLFSGACAVLTAWFTRNVFATMVAGLIVLWTTT